MGKMQKTKLAWDPYMDYLIDTINGSKFMKRAEDKPMSTPKAAEETHVTTRAVHLRQAADISRRLAKELGLNENYAYVGMLMHDAGHPFSAHEGEEIFTYLGEIYNTQFFHHNAKGVEIVLSEDICGKAITRIPGIEEKPELKKQLEDEFYYFLDTIISHDGEASKKEMKKKEESYDSIKDAVYDKLKRSNGKNDYKFTAQTPEGKLAKYSDVIAYLATDLQDGFRLGIYKDFSDKHLELFGRFFSENREAIPEENIACARKKINEIKRKNLRETRDSISREKDEDVLKAFSSILDSFEGDVLKNDEKALEAVVKGEIDSFKKKKLESFLEENNINEEEIRQAKKVIARKSKKGEKLTQEEEKISEFLNTVGSQTKKLREYSSKMLKVKSSVVYEVASLMQEFIIKDLVESTKEDERESDDNTKVIPHLSEFVENFFIEAKKINYEQFVPSTNWEYQFEELPDAVQRLTRKCAKGLIESGAIRDKFYDDSVRSLVKNQDALAYMKTAYRQEEQYDKYRRKQRIRSLKPHAKTMKGRFVRSEKQRTINELNKSVYKYVENQEEVFAIRYENTFLAVQERIRRKVDKATLPETSEKVEKSSKAQKNRNYGKQRRKLIAKTKREILDRYKTLDITPEQKEEFIKEKIEEELQNMEEKMAIQLASDYLAGMSDVSFNDLAIKTGCMKRRTILQSARTEEGSEKVKELKQSMER